MVRILCGLTVILFAATPMSSALAQETHDTLETKFDNPELREELLAMKDTDQNVRQEWITILSAQPTDTLALVKVVKKMDSIDNHNTTVLKDVIGRYGWPTAKSVGRNGIGAALLILQHSRDTLFQRTCLPLLQNAYDRGDVPGEALALLTDRILVHEGKPQLYGSQANIVDGKIILNPIADSINVDARRAKLGLSPLAQYIKLLEQMYHLDVK
jgi:Family of unknown function (DUF6624)